MQAKRLAARLAEELQNGKSGTEEFQGGLAKYREYQEAQRNAGKVTRKGKHSALLAPLIDAMPPEQRALGLHMSMEVAASADDIKEHVTTEIKKLQLRYGDPSRGTTYHVDHAAIRTSLERGGFTAPHLLQLYQAARLEPPTRRNAQHKDVAEKARYLLAQGLCRAAGSGEHEVAQGQLFDYATLNCWMEAMRHQQHIETWQPPVCPSCLWKPVQQRSGAKRPMDFMAALPGRRSQFVATSSGACMTRRSARSGGRKRDTQSIAPRTQKPTNDSQAESRLVGAPTGSQALPHCFNMPPEFEAHYRANFIAEDILERLSAHALTLFGKAEAIHLQRFPEKPLSQCLKVFMADAKLDGWYPQYQFAKMASKDYLKRTDIQGTPVADLVEMVRQNYSSDVSVSKGEPVCVANCYANGASDGIPSHRDQAFTIDSESECETVGSVYIFTVLEGPTGCRPLCFLNCEQNEGKGLHGHADIEAINKAGACISGAISMDHGSLLVLPGELNRKYYHCVLKEQPQEQYKARRVTYTIRFCMRLFVNACTKEYRVWNKSTRWQVHALKVDGIGCVKNTVVVNQKMCGDENVEPASKRLKASDGCDVPPSAGADPTGTQAVEPPEDGCSTCESSSTEDEVPLPEHLHAALNSELPPPLSSAIIEVLELRDGSPTPDGAMRGGPDVCPQVCNDAPSGEDVDLDMLAEKIADQ